MVKIAIQCDGLLDKGFGNRWAAAKRVGADGLGVTIRTAGHLRDLGCREYAARLRASADEHGLSLANLRVGDVLSRRIEARGDRPEASSEAIIKLAAWVAAEADIPCVCVPITGHIRIKRSADLLQAMSVLFRIIPEFEALGVTLGLECGSGADFVAFMLGEFSESPAKAVINTSLLPDDADLCRIIDVVGAHVVGQVLLNACPATEGALGPIGGNLLSRTLRQLRAMRFDGWLNLAGADRLTEAVLARSIAGIRNSMRAGDHTGVLQVGRGPAILAQDWRITRRQRCEARRPVE